MSFENSVKKWIELDNQLKNLNDQIKQIRDQRNTLQSNLTDYAKTNNLTNNAIQIQNNHVKFVDTKVAEPLTFKYLERTLGEIITNEIQIKQIIEHLKQKRIIKIIPEIKRLN
jgi:hypothetical protein